MGKTLLREVSLPKTTELASLGKASLRAIEPGVEILSGTSRLFANKILKLLSADEKMGRDADLLIVMNSQIPTDDLIVHFL